MNFINSYPKFREYPTDERNFEFYYKGVFDQPIENIIKLLSEGKMPNNLKGNFSFFYKDAHRVIIAVDHLPNYNLFYTEDNCSHIFYSLKTKDSKINAHIAQQMNFTWGGSVGTETNVIGINRLEAGTYLLKDLTTGKVTIDRYINLYEHTVDPNISIDDISKVTEDIIEEQTRHPFNLFWSSGTDSNCVLGFVRKLKREENCNLISLYSDSSTTDERPNIQYLEKEYGLSATFVNLGKYIGITDTIKSRLANPLESEIYKHNFNRTWYGFWYESNVFQKYTSLYDLGVHRKVTLTGEAGDQLFGSRFGKAILNVTTQIPSISNKQVAELFVSSDIFRFSRSFTQRPVSWQQSLESEDRRIKAYQGLIDWTENTWNNIDCSGDTINKVELLQYLYKASHRAYNYSQLSECNFVHPFADYRLFHIVFKTPGHWKIKNGKTRRLSLSMIKDYVNEGPWIWPKSGIQMPAQHTSRIKK